MNRNREESSDKMKSQGRFAETQPDSVERSLLHLRHEAQQDFLSDATFTQSLADKILREAKTEMASTSLSTRLSRIRRGFLPVLAALAAVAIALMVIPASFRSRLWSANGPFGMGQSDPSSLTSSGFAKAKPQLISDQFQGVTSIRIGFSQAAILGPNSLTIHLTGAEQRNLYQIMQNAKVVSSQNTPLPGMMTYRMDFEKQNGGMEGSYRGDGAMIMPGDSRLGQNQVNTFAPNPAFANFINDVVMPKYEALLKQDHTIFSNSPTVAAKVFLSHLSTPEKAYAYCMPGLLFTGMSFHNLLTKNQSLHYSDMSHTAPSYFDAQTAAVVHFQSGNVFNPHSLDVRVDKIGDGWVVTQVGTKIQKDSLVGTPSMSPLGPHHVVVIGDVLPSVRQPNAGLPSEQLVHYSNANAAALRSADIIVYERKGITGKSQQQLPTKTSQGHPDPNALKALADDPLFQQAVTDAKQNHGALVIVGNRDHLLSEWLIESALGDTSNGFSFSPQGDSYVIMTFGPSGQPVFNSGTDVQNGGKQMPLDPTMLREAVNSAELTLEQTARGLNR